MKKIIIVLVSSLLCFCMKAQQIECSFLQEKTIQASGRVIKSEGTISFTAPDQLAMLYTKPDGDYMIIDGPIIRSETKGNAVSINTDKNPSAKNLRNTLLNCITGKYEEAAKDNDADLKVSVKGQVKTVVISAKTEQPKGYSRLLLEYDAKGRLQRMVMDEFGGISTEYKLKY